MTYSVYSRPTIYSPTIGFIIRSVGSLQKSQVCDREIRSDSSGAPPGDDTSGIIQREEEFDND